MVVAGAGWAVVAGAAAEAGDENPTLDRVVRLVAACALSAAAAGAPAAASKQQTFGSPDEAVKALMAAVKAHDDKSMLAVLGSGAKKAIYSGDAVADRAGRERFAAAYDEANKLDLQGDAKAILSVGKDAWSFPIPVVKAGDGWRFDAKQGAEEILNRRIGRNELSTDPGPWAPTWMRSASTTSPIR